jgi:lysophospholipase L1-like esterase
MGNSVTSSNRSVLCFGDSLTEGLYYDHGPKFHPYALRLQDLLDLQSKQGKYRYKVKVEGYSGWTATSLLEALPSILNASYAFTIVLAGTNDLAKFESPGFNASVIFSSLQKIYDLVHAHGSKLVCVTVPQSSFKMKDYVALRDELNRLIREYCLSKNVVLVELDVLIPYEAAEIDNKNSLWSDALHFNPEGYDKFGGLLFEAMKNQLR